MEVEEPALKLKFVKNRSLLKVRMHMRMSPGSVCPANLDPERACWMPMQHDPAHGANEVCLPSGRVQGDWPGGRRSAARAGRSLIRQQRQQRCRRAQRQVWRR